LPGIDLEHEQQQKNRHGKTPKRQDSIIEDEQTTWQWNPNQQQTVLGNKQVKKELE
jgi:hypothetical protein